MRVRTRMGLVISASILAGVTAWAQGIDPPLGKSFRDLRRDLREPRYLVADQILILETQKRDLGSRILDAEAKVRDLHAQLQKTEQELVHAKELLESLHGVRAPR